MKKGNSRNNKGPKKQGAALKRFFGSMGFSLYSSDGIEIDFKNKKTDIDLIAIYENIIILVEHTEVAKITDHFFKKLPIYQSINASGQEFIGYAKSVYPGLDALIQDKYDAEHLVVKILYVSSVPPDDQVLNNNGGVYFLYDTKYKYFSTLSSTIKKSSRFEFFKFLEIESSAVGGGVFSSSLENKTFDCYILPSNASSHPSGYKFISFYADPASLLEYAYVLRRDGWEGDEFFYQRILVDKKIKEMRGYLANEGRVFVNNIILSLPDDAILEEDEGSTKVSVAKIRIPKKYNSIAVIDGQHRVYCYHESDDNLDSKIGLLRQKQQLLATAIMFPPNMPEIKKREFEARLFLEINKNQTSAKASLKQDIELMLNPASVTAVAKRVLKKLGTSGIYNGVLYLHYFDDAKKIKTSSVVSFGLKPAVKFEGDDSIFCIWGSESKNKILNKNNDPDSVAIEEYVNFCANKLNELFVPAKLKFSTLPWDVNANPRSELMSPTVINGLIAFLRLLIKHERPTDADDLKGYVDKIGSFDFSQYKSSHWQMLGAALYSRVFPGADDDVDVN